MINGDFKISVEFDVSTFYRRFENCGGDISMKFEFSARNAANLCGLCVLNGRDNRICFSIVTLYRARNI